MRETPGGHTEMSVSMEGMIRTIGKTGSLCGLRRWDGGRLCLGHSKSFDREEGNMPRSRTKEF